MNAAIAPYTTRAILTSGGGRLCRMACSSYSTISIKTRKLSPKISTRRTTFRA